MSEDLDAVVSAMAADEGGGGNMDAYRLARLMLDRKIIRITDHAGKGYDHAPLKAFFALVEELKEIL